jgi:DNA (cytosine-5)-methyltransferase 1
MKRVLDLYCGGGGAGKGYADAGFDVRGVDIAPQPRYPFPFIQADAIEYCRAHGAEFDLIHASPVCKRYSITRSLHTNEYPDQIPELRNVLRFGVGIPYVIENVVGAPLIEPVMLCGQMFGLPLYRHRLFECSFFLLAPPHPAHREAATGTKGMGKQSGAPIQTVTGSNYLAAKGRAAMGIDWLPMRSLSQAIPPAYTRFIGTAFLQCEVLR